MIERLSYAEKIQKGFKSNPLVILIGVRQVGKTTLMEMYVKDKFHIWLNGQNPETAEIFESFSVIERYLKINMNEDIDGLLVIDEFQYIEKISTTLKLLVDKYKKLKVLCSGSSSLQIMQNVEESLAGRIRIINVFALSFPEYIKFQDVDLWEKFQLADIQDDINTLFKPIPQLLKEYLTYGGLPKIAITKDYSEKIELLNDIYKTYLLKDVKEFIKNKDFIAFNKLLKILSSQTGNLININEIANTIQLPYRKCEEYINILEQMFIINLLVPFSSNLRKEVSKMKKLYFCDTGLRNIVYNSFNDIDIRVDNGQIFENYIYLQLIGKHKPENIQFYRTKDNTEIDFILKTIKGELIPIEAKFKSFKKHKKIRAISEFEKKYQFSKAYVVNKSLVKSSEKLHYIQPYSLYQI
ncbi:MAG: ATP-binding protein [Bacteroidota bacterium]|nr:ATP-binding protein [Bacteroidota bacterium]